MKKKFGLAAVVVALAMVFMGCQHEEEHVHSFPAEWSYDKDSHWKDATCGCDEKVDFEPHCFSDWEIVVQPTEYDDGSKERFCSTCGYKKTEKIYALGHHHNLMSEWSSDETNHWHAYNCGRDDHIEDKANHTEGSGTVTKEPTCTEKGTKIYKCTVCKRELRTEDIVAKGHSLGDWVWNTTGSPLKHWKVCTECGNKINEDYHDYEYDYDTSSGVHSGFGKFNDEYHWNKCKTCGFATEYKKHDIKEYLDYDLETHWMRCRACFVRLEESPHIFTDWVEDARDPSRHERECEGCGFSIEKDHSYDWIITDDKHWEECSMCGKKRNESMHFRDFVTTDKKHWKECDVCGGKIEEAVHTFIYSGNNWQECKCGKKIPVSLDTLGTYDPSKMTFGFYPQTIKASDVTVDKTIKNKETSMECYLGSDGAWYVEYLERAKGSGEQYKYSDGSTVAPKTANSVKYFKVEPIEWVYLAETKCLLAKNILYGLHDWSSVNINNYATSSIRNWLNGDFYTIGLYKSAFTANQKKKIKTITVDNSAESTTDEGNNLTKATSYACVNTEDKIFLLSEKEVTTSGNGFTAYNEYGPGNSRIKFPTDFALATNCGRSSNLSYGGYWWLRSPAEDNHLVYYINCDGRNFTEGRLCYDSNNSGIGIVPALSLYEY